MQIQYCIKGHPVLLRLRRSYRIGNSSHRSDINIFSISPSPFRTTWLSFQPQSQSFSKSSTLSYSQVNLLVWFSFKSALSRLRHSKVWMWLLGQSSQLLSPTQEALVLSEASVIRLRYSDSKWVSLINTFFLSFWRWYYLDTRTEKRTRWQKRTFRCWSLNSRCRWYSP